MGVDLPSYRFSIGVSSSIVAASTKVSRFGSRLRQTSVTYSRHSYFVAVLYLFLLLRAVALPRAGDVHRNPGPSSSPPFYNSNLNSKPDSMIQPRLQPRRPRPLYPWRGIFVRLDAVCTAVQRPESAPEAVGVS